MLTVPRAPNLENDIMTRPLTSIVARLSVAFSGRRTLGAAAVLIEVEDSSLAKHADHMIERLGRMHVARPRVW